MADAFELERRVAIEAVREAAELCGAVQALITADVLQKKDRSPVTVADFGSQALVCRAVREAFPDDPIIAEEDSAELRRPDNATLQERVVQHVRRILPTADSQTVCEWIDFGDAANYSERFWTLDPIDGTKGFLRSEQYAVSLALIVGGRIQVGALACPNLPVDPTATGLAGAVFIAVRGQGASVLPMSGGPAMPVRASSCVDPSQARFCESVESGHSQHGQAAAVAARLGIALPPIRMDSQAKYAVVARGEADIYLRLPTDADYREKIWDHAGGALVISEAGGTVTDIDGRPLDFTRGRELTVNRGVVATNGHLHEQVLAAVREVLNATENDALLA